MLAVILGFLAKLLPSLFGQFLAKPNPIATQAEQIGQLKADLATERQANAEVQAATQAANAVAAADAAHPDRLRNGGDPDCRDCETRSPGAH